MLPWLLSHVMDPLTLLNISPLDALPKRLIGKEPEDDDHGGFGDNIKPCKIISQYCLIHTDIPINIDIFPIDPTILMAYPFHFLDDLLSHLSNDFPLLWWQLRSGWIRYLDDCSALRFMNWPRHSVWMSHYCYVLCCVGMASRLLNHSMLPKISCWSIYLFTPKTSLSHKRAQIAGMILLLTTSYIPYPMIIFWHIQSRT